MSRKQTPKATRSSESKKVGILLPSDVYSKYEQIARDERITVAQVIARVSIEFVDVENEASRSRRSILGAFKEEMLGKSRPASRQIGRRG
jgi:hypothetical protein